MQEQAPEAHPPPRHFAPEADDQDEPALVPDGARASDEADGPKRDSDSDSDIIVEEQFLEEAFAALGPEPQVLHDKVAPSNCVLGVVLENLADAFSTV